VELALVELHQLDDLEDEVLFVPDERHEVVQFVLVDAVEEDHVKFDRGQPHLDRRIDPREDIREAVFARDLAVALGPETVEADVHPGKPGLFEFRGLRCKQRPVRRQGSLDARRHRADDVGKIAAEQRLSAGELNAPDAELHAHLHQLSNILRAHLLLRVHLTLCVAVDAPQVAPGGQADSKVGHGPVIGVFQHHRMFL
jgi:hypothetical protein